MSDVELKRFGWAAVCVGRDVEAVWEGRLQLLGGELKRFGGATVCVERAVEAVWGGGCVCRTGR